MTAQTSGPGSAPVDTVGAASGSELGLSGPERTSWTLTERLCIAADFTANLPEAVPMPTVTVHPWQKDIDVTWHLGALGESDQRAAAAGIRRALGGEWSKVGSGDTFWLSHEGSRDGVTLDFTIFCDREQVCRRVVTGTEEVVLPAVEAQPERTETREIVEWQCDPIAGERL